MTSFWSLLALVGSDPAVPPAQSYDWSDVVVALSIALGLIISFFVVSAIGNWVFGSIGKRRDEAYRGGTQKVDASMASDPATGASSTHE
jgi:hypothetical protein